MWKQLFDIVPLPILLGIGVVAGSVYLASPEIARRIAATQALPDCLAGKLAAPASRRDVERDLAIEALGLLGSLQDGGVLSEAARAIRHRLDGRRETTLDLTARCRCLVELVARDAHVRTEITVWFLSLRLIEGAAINGFGGEMARHDRNLACGSEVAR